MSLHASWIPFVPILCLEPNHGFIEILKTVKFFLTAIMSIEMTDMGMAEEYSFLFMVVLKVHICP